MIHTHRVKWISMQLQIVSVWHKMMCHCSFFMKETNLRVWHSFACAWAATADGRWPVTSKRTAQIDVPITHTHTHTHTHTLTKLTYASPAWSTGLGVGLKKSLEKLQKRALKISLGRNYTSYENDLATTNLPFLAYDPSTPHPPPTQYEQIVSKFALSLSAHPRHRNFLPPPSHRLHI